MGGIIKVPVERYKTTYVKAHHCKFRYGFDQGIAFYSPSLLALKSIGFLPLPPTIAERVEARLDDVRFYYGNSALTYQSDISRYGAWMRRAISNLKNSDPPSYHLSDDSYGLADTVLQNILVPEDFTFEQRISLFDFFSAKVVEASDECFYHRTAGHYHDYSFNPPVKFVDRWDTLKVWTEIGRKYVEERIDQLFVAQAQIRDMTGYDWSPLTFLFGDDLTRLTQLKTTFLESELELEKNTLRKEYENFLGVVDEASRLGSMRSNSITLDSTFLGKFKIHVSITDVGSGAKLARAVNEKVNDVTGFARDVGDVATGLGKIAVGIGKILFGKS